MRLVALACFGISVCAPLGVMAQSVLFDFDNAPIHTSLPVKLTVGGVTAQLSATGQGFSIQPANTLGFTPVGFSGNCIYPNSIYAADLVVSFSPALNGFSILYAPEELGCDSSATMRATAFIDGTLVGTATTNASSAGTWPSEVLALSSTQSFNSVLVHYDSSPACQDWGPIFMADNMAVITAPQPLILTNAAILSNGAFQFSWSAHPGTPFSVLATTNMLQPFSNWSVLGAATEPSAGNFQFADLPPANSAIRFYRVRSP